jgi:Flp pilus assembly protein protease CpaA
MQVTKLLNRIPIDPLIYTEYYKLGIEAAAVLVLCYVGFTDFRTFKIRNQNILLLLILYAMYAVVVRSTLEILANVILATIMFALLVWLYTKHILGAGDVKLIPVICLWVGGRCALLYSALLLMLIGFHLASVGMGWAPTHNMAGRRGIPYAPSLAGALIGIILLGCL